MFDRPFFSPMAVKASSVATGVKVKVGSAVDGTDIKAGDVGVIKREQLHRGRGGETYITFDDGVQAKLPDGTEVYPVISENPREELADIGKGIARRIGQVVRSVRDNWPKIT